MNKFLISLLLCTVYLTASAQQTGKWGDQGDGSFRNPILACDFSDPDPIRVGNDYYMAASTFESVPGVTILHSRDLVNWEIIGGAIENLAGLTTTASPREMSAYGDGVYAPSLRYHDGKFWVYVNLKEDGMLMCQAEKPEGPWTAQYLKDRNGHPIRVRQWTDPCPFWDEDGRAYLAVSHPGHAPWYSYLFEMTPDGTQLLDADTDYMNQPGIVYEHDKGGGTLYSPNYSSEGNKIYKRNGYYYLVHIEFAGPNSGTWVYRSRNIYGTKADGTPGKPGDPGEYEKYRTEPITLTTEDSARIGKAVHPVTDQSYALLKNFFKGLSKEQVQEFMNKQFDPSNKHFLPGQGGFVDTPDGRWFYIGQLQEGNVDGRNTLLVPVQWIDDWPVLGLYPDEELHGQMVWQMPKPIKSDDIILPHGSDNFDGPSLKAFWQWNHQPVNSRWSLAQRPGYMRLMAAPTQDGKDCFFGASNTLLQRNMRSDSVCITVKLDISHMAKGQYAGVAHFNGGLDYGYLAVRMEGKQKQIVYERYHKQQYHPNPEVETLEGELLPADASTLYIRNSYNFDNLVQYEYSLDGEHWTAFGPRYEQRYAAFRGDMIGIFTWNQRGRGYIDVDSFDYSIVNK